MRGRCSDCGARTNFPSRYDYTARGNSCAQLCTGPEWDNGYCSSGESAASFRALTRTPTTKPSHESYCSLEELQLSKKVQKSKSKQRTMQICIGKRKHEDTCSEEDINEIHNKAGSKKGKLVNSYCSIEELDYLTRNMRANIYKASKIIESESMCSLEDSNEQNKRLQIMKTSIPRKRKQKKIKIENNSYCSLEDIEYNYRKTVEDAALSKLPISKFSKRNSGIQKRNSCYSNIDTAIHEIPISESCYSDLSTVSEPTTGIFPLHGSRLLSEVQSNITTSTEQYSKYQKGFRSDDGSIQVTLSRIAPGYTKSMPDLITSDISDFESNESFQIVRNPWAISKLKSNTGKSSIARSQSIKSTIRNKSVLGSKNKYGTNKNRSKAKHSSSKSQKIKSNNKQLKKKISRKSKIGKSKSRMIQKKTIIKKKLTKRITTNQTRKNVLKSSTYRDIAVMPNKRVAKPSKSSTVQRPRSMASVIFRSASCDPCRRYSKPHPNSKRICCQKVPKSKCNKK